MPKTWTPTPPLPSPIQSTGPIGWMRKNLFSSPANSILTLFSVYLLYILITPLIQWAVVDATWLGNSRACCDEAAALGKNGACWTFVKVRLNMFLYGFYPKAEQWRINFIMLILLFHALPILLPDIINRKKRIGFTIMALVAALLLFGPVPMIIVFLFAVLPMFFGRLSTNGSVPLITLQGFAGVAFRLLAGIVIGCIAGSISKELGAAETATYIGLVSGVLIWVLLQVRNLGAGAWQWVMLFTCFPLLAFILLSGNAFGLAHVETHYWGGLFLTLVVAVTGMGTALPIGILLALGRRSTLPVIRTVCICFIEFARGIPLVSVLFMVSVMLPLMLPHDVNFDKLLRALIGIAFFYAAYMAEVVRGGLQAIPSQQYEAAQALGWTYWRMMFKIILPQTLRLIIPGLANNFLSLLKDTTLVAVIGLFDLLGISKAAMADADWLGFTKESYLFSAMVFWILCFCMSRYFLYLERKYHTSYH
ncbi:amino acid ABC transporter permease [Maridesulfovibrio zosterae]|uniref:amino acid ABC transporter permease n=1 Tax=Maridesulfovibrio zosterae TaxID=82171 RepID=UPI00040081AA|nr:amino acid ABC transporter permease [Maridesulfovibrio zosterae]